MNFAVVKIAGKQFLVSENQELSVEGKIGEGEKSLTFSEVLLLGTPDGVQIGTPYLPKTEIKAEIQKIAKGDKIRISKFKAKSRYRRVMGFRPFVTSLKFLPFYSEGESKKIAGQEVKKAKRLPKKSGKIKS